jgi:hypothetical protein
MTTDHCRVLRLKKDDRIIDELGILPGKKLTKIGNCGGETDDIRIDPPTALLSKQPIPEKICKGSRRALAGAAFVCEKTVRADERRRVANRHARRNGKMGSNVYKSNLCP